MKEKTVKAKPTAEVTATQVGRRWRRAFGADERDCEHGEVGEGVELGGGVGEDLKGFGGFDAYAAEDDHHSDDDG